MKNNQFLNTKIEKTLSSLDGMERAAPRPFLFTRVMAKMQATKETVWEKAGRLIGRPSFAIAGLSFVIVLNLVIITFHSKENDSKALRSADYYSLNDMAIDNITNTAH